VTVARAAVLACALALAAGAEAASAPQIVPATPTAFEPVKLRMTVDSCAFEPGTVHVGAAAGVLRVTQEFNQCLVPAQALVVDVQLGAFPAGDYRVELYATSVATGTPALTLSFSVRDPATIAVVPSPPRPLDTYTGMWWTPSESGWGLSLQQSAAYTLFGVLFVYGPGQDAQWFTLQDGRWTSSTTWTASVYGTRGPYYGGAFDPARVSITPVGSASLDFAQPPGREDTAVLRYTLDGTTVTKTIARLRF
jgi:hypothetical protein